MNITHQLLRRAFSSGVSLRDQADSPSIMSFTRGAIVRIPPLSPELTQRILNMTAERAVTLFALAAALCARIHEIEETPLQSLKEAITGKELPKDYPYLKGGVVKHGATHDFPFNQPGNPDYPYNPALEYDEQVESRRSRTLGLFGSVLHKLGAAVGKVPLYGPLFGTLFELGAAGAELAKDETSAVGANPEAFMSGKALKKLAKRMATIKAATPSSAQSSSLAETIEALSMLQSMLAGGADEPDYPAYLPEAGSNVMQQTSQFVAPQQAFYPAMPQMQMLPPYAVPYAPPVQPMTPQASGYPAAIPTPLPGATLYQSGPATVPGLGQVTHGRMDAAIRRFDRVSKRTGQPTLQDVLYDIPFWTSECRECSAERRVMFDDAPFFNRAG